MLMIKLSVAERQKAMNYTLTMLLLFVSIWYSLIKNIKKLFSEGNLYNKTIKYLNTGGFFFSVLPFHAKMWNTEDPVHLNSVTESLD